MIGRTAGICGLILVHIVTTTVTFTTSNHVSEEWQDLSRLAYLLHRFDKRDGHIRSARRELNDLKHAYETLITYVTRCYSDKKDGTWTDDYEDSSNDTNHKYLHFNTESCQEYEHAMHQLVRLRAASERRIDKMLLRNQFIKNMSVSISVEMASLLNKRKTLEESKQKIRKIRNTYRLESKQLSQLKVINDSSLIYDRWFVDYALTNTPHIIQYDRSSLDTLQSHWNYEQEFSNALQHLASCGAAGCPIAQGEMQDTSRGDHHLIFREFLQKHWKISRLVYNAYNIDLKFETDQTLRNISNEEVVTSGLDHCRQYSSMLPGYSDLICGSSSSQSLPIERTESMNLRSLSTSFPRVLGGHGGPRTAPLGMHTVVSPLQEIEVKLFPEHEADLLYPRYHSDSILELNEPNSSILALLLHHLIEEHTTQDETLADVETTYPDVDLFDTSLTDLPSVANEIFNFVKSSAIRKNEEQYDRIVRKVSEKQCDVEFSKIKNLPVIELNPYLTQRNCDVDISEQSGTMISAERVMSMMSSLVSVNNLETFLQYPAALFSQSLAGKVSSSQSLFIPSGYTYTWRTVNQSTDAPAAIVHSYLDPSNIHIARSHLIHLAHGSNAARKLLKTIETTMNHTIDQNPISCSIDDWNSSREKKKMAMKDTGPRKSLGTAALRAERRRRKKESAVEKDLPLITDDVTLKALPVNKFLSKYGKYEWDSLIRQLTLPNPEQPIPISNTRETIQVGWHSLPETAHQKFKQDGKRTSTHDNIPVLGYVIFAHEIHSSQQFDSSNHLESISDLENQLISLKNKNGFVGEVDGTCKYVKRMASSYSATKLYFADLSNSQLQIPCKSSQKKSVCMTLTELKPGEGYVIRVAALSAAGLSSFSEATAPIYTSPMDTPSKPDWTKLQSVSPWTLSLSWRSSKDDGGSTILGYLVHVFTHESTSGRWIRSMIVPGRFDSCSIKGLLPGSYHVSVAAVNSVGIGETTNSSVVTTKASGKKGAIPTLTGRGILAQASKNEFGVIPSTHIEIQRHLSRYKDHIRLAKKLIKYRKQSFQGIDLLRRGVASSLPWKTNGLCKIFESGNKDIDDPDLLFHAPTLHDISIVSLVHAVCIIAHQTPTVTPPDISETAFIENIINASGLDGSGAALELGIPFQPNSKIPMDANPTRIDEALSPQPNLPQPCTGIVAKLSDTLQTVLLYAPHEEILISGWASHFSPRMYDVKAELVRSQPFFGPPSRKLGTNNWESKGISNHYALRNRIVVFRRGEIPLWQKAKSAAMKGALGVIIIDDTLVCQKQGFTEACVYGSRKDKNEGFGAIESPSKWKQAAIPVLLINQEDGNKLLPYMVKWTN